MICKKCGKKIELKKAESLVFFYCENCKIGGKGKTEKEATENFERSFEFLPAQIEIPKSKNELIAWGMKNNAVLIDRAAKFIDRPATKRMIEKNIRYAMSADLKDAWSNPEGIESIIDALQESFEIGATLPEMGCIIPFGKTVEFIPAVSAFTFALTNGINAPFSRIIIDCIYKNDIFEAGRSNGNFKFEMKKIGLPRGDIIGIVVMATETRTGITVGELFDEKRLMEKAQTHSKSYKYYLADMDALKKAKSEERNFIEKFGKKFYERDIVNPYVGADKPEMLKKVAGKSFFAPYMKIRNAIAVEAEVEAEDKSKVQFEKMTESVLNVALEQVKDADFSQVPAYDSAKSASAACVDNSLFDE